MSRATNTTDRERLEYLRDEFPEGSFFHEYAQLQLESLDEEVSN